MWRSLTALERQMEELFAAALPPQGRVVAGGLKLNVWQDDENYHLSAEVPGLTMDQIDVQAQHDVLTIRTSPPAENDAPGQYLHRERVLRASERTLSLPTDVQVDAITATLADGVLTITLPKAASARPRQIEVRARES